MCLTGCSHNDKENVIGSDVLRLSDMETMGGGRVLNSEQKLNLVLIKVYLVNC